MRRLLRSVRHEPRPPSAPARGPRDWALVAVLALAVLVETAARPELPWRAATAVIALALLPTLLIRRSHPAVSVILAFVVTGIAAPVIGGEPRLNTMVFLLLLPYALYRWGAGTEILLGSAVILLKIASSLLVADFGPSEALSGLGVLVAACAVGTAFRYRASARSRELAQVRLTERERLARDLHDTVAHHVSAIAVRAQAGIAVAPGEPDAAVDALRVIEGEASRTLAEMRAIVRTLRAEDNSPAVSHPTVPDDRGHRAGTVPADADALDRAPVPRLIDLAALADSAVPTVQVELVGDVEAVPAPVGTAVYRIAQESVTNARRHARSATRIDIRVTADDTAVHLHVHDDGEDAAPGPGGYGLRGMAERAGLLGGHCEAGPDPDRGWTVTATLPRIPA